MDTNFVDRCREIINDAIKKGARNTKITPQNNPFMSSLALSHIIQIFERLKLWYWNQYSEPIGMCFGGIDSGSRVDIFYVSRPNDILRVVVWDGGSIVGKPLGQEDSKSYEANKKIGYDNCLNAIKKASLVWDGPINKIPDFKLGQNMEGMIGYTWDYLYYDIQKMVSEKTQWVLQRESDGWSLIKK